MRLSANRRSEALARALRDRPTVFVGHSGLRARWRAARFRRRLGRADYRAVLAAYYDAERLLGG